MGKGRYCQQDLVGPAWEDRKSTRLNSSHSQISYAVFCLKKKSETDRGRADTAGAALHEQGFTACQGAALNDVGPHGEDRLRQHARFGARQALRQRQAASL